MDAAVNPVKTQMFGFINIQNKIKIMLKFKMLLEWIKTIDCRKNVTSFTSRKRHYKMYAILFDYKYYIINRFIYM